MFVYVMVMIRKSGRLKYTDLLHLIPFLIVTVWFTFRFFVLSGPEKLDFYDEIYSGSLPRDVAIMTFPNILTGPVYVILSLIMLSGHTRRIANDFSYTEQINLNWLKYVIGGLGFVFLVVIVSNVLVRFPFLEVTMHEHLIYLAISISVFFLGYFGIKQQAIYKSVPSPVNVASTGKQKKQKRNNHNGTCF